MPIAPRARGRGTLVGAAVLLLVVSSLATGLGAAAPPSPRQATGTVHAPPGELPNAPGSAVAGASSAGGKGSVSSVGPSPSENLTVGTPEWSAVGSASSVPDTQGAGMTYDPTDGEFVAFGGASTVAGVGTLPSNATWTFRSGSWSQLCPEMSGQAKCATMPPARVGALLTYDPVDGAVLMAGGSSTTGNSSATSGLNDLWSFRAGGWTNETGTGVPSGIWDGEMAFDPVDGYLLALNQTGITWSYSLISQNWTRVGPLDHPTARTHGAMFYDPSLRALVLYGGLSGAGRILNDTWTYADGSWTKLDLGRNVPSARMNSANRPVLAKPIASGYDGGLGVGVVVDPTGTGSNATWFFTGSAWYNATDELGGMLPDAGSASLGFDAADGVGVLLDVPTGSSSGTSWLFTDAMRLSTGWLVQALDANQTAAVHPALGGGLPPYATGIDVAASVCSLSGAASGTPSVLCGDATPGTVNFTLAFSDSLGRRSNVSYSITVNADPTLALPTVTPNPTSVGVPVRYSAQILAGTPPYPAPNWTFDDGGSATGMNASHAFRTSGVHSVTVRARDATGFGFSFWYSVDVNAGPSASVVANLSETDPGIPVAFSAGVVGGTGGTTCAWNFGNGATASACDVNYSYPSAGQFRARFWSNDSVGATGEGNLSVYVAPSLAASFEPPVVAFAGQPIGLTATETGGVGPYAVDWSFGDGGSARGESVGHSFGLPGTYVVTESVRDAVGARSTYSLNLTVAVDGSSLPGDGGSSGPTTGPGGSFRAPASPASPGPSFAPPWLLIEILGAIVATALLTLRARRSVRRSPEVEGAPEDAGAPEPSEER